MKLKIFLISLIFLPLALGSCKKDPEIEEMEQEVEEPAPTPVGTWDVKFIATEQAWFDSTGDYHLEEETRVNTGTWTFYEDNTGLADYTANSRVNFRDTFYWDIDFNTNNFISFNKPGVTISGQLDPSEMFLRIDRKPFQGPDAFYYLYETLELHKED